MTSIPVDIVLLPSDELAQKAIAASGQLQKHDALFALSTEGPFPHASLYMTQLKDEDIDRAAELLAALANATGSFELTAARYCQSQGYIDSEYEKTERLARLQMDVVAAINPIRDGMLVEDKARMLEATGLVRANLEQYGYRGVGELFRPHMTLTRFAGGKQIDAAELPSPQDFSGQFTKLGLFEMGDNGTCVRKIAEFELKGKGGVYRGDIIEESLADKSTLQAVRIVGTRVEPVTPRHKTPWLKQWILHAIEVPEADAERMAEDLSRSLEKCHTNWYIDFKNETTHYVIFPGKVFRVDRDQPEQYKPVVSYGVRWGVPRHQLGFSPVVANWERPQE